MENQELLSAMKQLLDSSLEPIRSDLKDIQDRTKRIELTLENEVTQRLDALADGYKLHNEKLDQILTTVDDLESASAASDVMHKLAADEIIKLKILK